MSLSTTLAEIAAPAVGVEHIDALAEAVNDVFEMILDDDPDPCELASMYLTEPSAMFVADRAVAGVPLPQNSATAKALFSAATDLHAFYDAEIAPLPGTGSSYLNPWVQLPRR
jgi:hypothetical protein